MPSVEYRRGGAVPTMRSMQRLLRIQTERAMENELIDIEQHRTSQRNLDHLLMALVFVVVAALAGLVATASGRVPAEALAAPAATDGIPYLPAQFEAQSAVAEIAVPVPTY
jgi:hypothetical protein